MIRIPSHGTRTRTRLRAATIAVVLVSTAWLAGAVPASASVGDPIATGCASDAYTVSTKPIKNSTGGVIGQTQLRYSPHCGTNWAKAVSYIGNAWIQAIVASPTDSAWRASHFPDS